MRVLLACGPKSGSTFIAKALCAALGCVPVALTPGYGRREQELSEAAIRAAGDGFVAQHHVRFSEITSDLLQRYDIKPVVLTRNLHDTVISIRDHLEKEGVVGPLAYLDDSFNALPMAEKTSAIVDLMTPWYLSFERSWADCPVAARLTYESFFSDPINSLVSLCGQLQVDCPPERAGEALAGALVGFNRFNVGQMGRGRVLSGELKARIDRMASHFGAHDFSALGLFRVRSAGVGVSGGHDLAARSA